MTLPEEALAAAFATARRFVQAPPPGAARLLGIHMEGPFFSAEKCGAQNPAHLRAPDAALLRRLNEGCGGLIRLIDVAPELPGALPFIEAAKAVGTVSVAHTAATYEQARAAFDAGATHVTHLFNAMPPLLHRAPGVIGAAAENPAVSAELIADGLHVHESAVRAAFRLFGAARICLISDALSVCGMPDGAYHLGDQPVYLSGGIARLSGGTIAGAAANLMQGLQNAVRFGIAPEDAVRAATFNPARAVRAEHEGGRHHRPRPGGGLPGVRAGFFAAPGVPGRRGAVSGGGAAPAYAVRRSSRRTLALEVLRDGTVLVRAPRALPDAAIERFVRERRAWIARAQAAQAAAAGAVPGADGRAGAGAARGGAARAAGAGAALCRAHGRVARVGARHRGAHALWQLQCKERAVPLPLSDAVPARGGGLRRRARALAYPAQKPRPRLLGVRGRRAAGLCRPPRAAFAVAHRGCVPAAPADLQRSFLI